MLRCLRLGLGGLLVVAGALKLRAPAAFATEIANYQLFPGARALRRGGPPVVELSSGAGRSRSPRLAPRGRARRARPFATFTVAVASAIFRRINIDCGCFGAGGGPINVLTLARNLLLVAAAASAVRGDAADRAYDGR